MEEINKECEESCPVITTAMLPSCSSSSSCCLLSHTPVPPLDAVSNEDASCEHVVYCTEKRGVSLDPSCEHVAHCTTEVIGDGELKEEVQEKQNNNNKKNNKTAAA